MTDETNIGPSVLDFLQQSMRTRLMHDRLYLLREIAKLQEELTAARKRIKELEKP